MSGQYPSGYNSPLGGHRGQFNPQQQQQAPQLMNPCMPMGGYHPQQQMSSGMGMTGGGGLMGAGMSVQQQQQQMQHQQIGAGGQVGSGGMMAVGGGAGINTGAGSLMQQAQQQMGAGMPMPQQQQQQSQAQTTQSAGGLMHAQGGAQPPPGSNNMLAISQPNPHKEINIVALSRLGQETVQDITSRFQEIFAALKIIQPTANRDNNTEKKVQEYFRTIRLLFKRVRIIYEKCNDGYPQGMEYTHVESLIPYRDEPDHRIEPTQCDEYRKALQENQELIETVKLKNRQLREIIDRTRIIIWEINTMLSMRRS